MFAGGDCCPPYYLGGTSGSTWGCVEFGLDLAVGRGMFGYRMVPSRVIQGRGDRREPTKLCLELRSVQWFRLFLLLFEYFGERVNHSRCSGLTLAQGYFPFDVFRWNIRRIEHSLDSLLHELPHGFIGVVETTVARATLVSEMHVAWALLLLGRISRSGLVVEHVGSIILAIQS